MENWAAGGLLWWHGGKSRSIEAAEGSRVRNLTGSLGGSQFWRKFVNVDENRQRFDIASRSVCYEQNKTSGQFLTRLAYAAAEVQMI